MITVIKKQDYKEIWDDLAGDFEEFSSKEYRRGSNFFVTSIHIIDENNAPNNPELHGFWESNVWIWDAEYGGDSSDIATLTRVVKERKEKLVVTETWVPVKSELQSIVDVPISKVILLPTKFQGDAALYKSSIIELLKGNICNVEFTKTDGTNRCLMATLLDDYIEREHQTDSGSEQGSGTSNQKLPRKSNPDVISVWSIEDQGWRSFRLKSLKSISPNTK